MLTEAKDPVAWAMLLYELSDAHEHLGELIDAMAKSGEIDEIDFRIDLGHVYAHLNRAWHSRADEGLDSISHEQFEERSKFPTDLEPV